MLNPKTNTIDSTVLIPNLLGFIVANQEEAFRFANNGNLLKSFATVCNNSQGRVIENYPSLCVIIDELETGGDGDLLEGKWRVRLEIAAESDKPEAVTVELHKYADAVEKCMVDIGDALAANSRQKTIARIGKNPVKSFDEAGLNKASKWAQECIVEAEYDIRTSAFKD